jgi:transcriptional regulator NrdR family protein
LVVLVKGFRCPHCRGERLYVLQSRRPAAGLIVRYRECSACGHRVVTEERVSKSRKVKADGQ